MSTYFNKGFVRKMNGKGQAMLYITLRGGAKFRMSVTTLSVLATIIGAIATFGGLVVVIISLVSLFQIHKQVDIRFNEKYEAHRQALDQLSAQWATGIRYWTQATMSPDLDKASQLMELALAAWPTAPGARTEMLRRLYEETERAYILDLIPYQRHSMRSRDLSGVSFPAIPFPESYFGECMKWCILALDHEVTNSGPWLYLTAAKLDAMQGETASMMRHLAAWLSTGPDVPDGKSILVISSALRNMEGFKLLQTLWTSRFTQSLTADLAAALEIYRENRQKTGELRLQVWLVTPKHTGDKPGPIGITLEGDTGWAVVDDLSVADRHSATHVCNNMDDVLAYVNRRWMALHPIPYYW